MTAVIVLIRIEKKTNIPRGSLWPIQAWPGPDGMNRVYGGLMRVKRYPVNSIPFFVLFFFYQASLTTAGLAASRSGAGGIGLAITTTSYDIRFVAHVSQPQERVGENGKIKKKKRREKDCASLVSGRQSDNDPKDWVGARSNRNVGVAGWTGS